MFSKLSNKLSESFRRLSKRGKITKSELHEAVRQLRRILLDADVNYKVAKQFCKAIEEKSQIFLENRPLDPGKALKEMVQSELTELLGRVSSPIIFSSSRSVTVILLAGLQGSGKTTTAAKLAKHLKMKGRKPLLTACDTYRPAAVEQLEVLASSIDVPIYKEGKDPVERAVGALNFAEVNGIDTVILDTAGRLSLDDELMEEINRIRKATEADERIFVADAMAGQQILQVADKFNLAIQLTGAILTKMDGDARGGAAISIRQVTSVPIKFIGTGEAIEKIEEFHPDRISSRILGEGDILTFAENVSNNINVEEAKSVLKKIGKSQFGFDDFLKQIEMVKKMGSFSTILKMIPGASKFADSIQEDEYTKQLKTIKSMIQSMTPVERSDWKVIKGSRKRRIALGSGNKVEDVNKLLKQFKASMKMMGKMKNKKGLSGLSSMLGGRL